MKYSIVQRKGGEVLMSKSQFIATYLKAKPQATPQLKFQTTHHGLWSMSARTGL